MAPDARKEYPDQWQNMAYVKSRAEYEKMYKRSVEDPNGFWRDLAVSDYAWQAEPDQQHMSYNFDVRKVRGGLGEVELWLGWDGWVQDQGLGRVRSPGQGRGAEGYPACRVVGQGLPAHHFAAGVSCTCVELWCGLQQHA